MKFIDLFVPSTQLPFEKGTNDMNSSRESFDFKVAKRLMPFRFLVLGIVINIVVVSFNVLQHLLAPSHSSSGRFTLFAHLLYLFTLLYMLQLISKGQVNYVQASKVMLGYSLVKLLSLVGSYKSLLVMFPLGGYNLIMYTPCLGVRRLHQD
jgi:uncharacterized membrane protein YesL